MKLATRSIENRNLIYFIAVLIVLGGMVSFTRLGQLEDPEFTIKNAFVVTAYPGASPEEVELEVTDRIELAIQEIPEVDHIESTSSPGLSTIQVTIKPVYWGDKLPQIWDELRRKIREVETTLPPGAERPAVSDSFGDVFGFQLALIGDGFSYDELEDFAKSLKTELSLVDGVARIELWGRQQPVIYVDATEAQLTELGVSKTQIIQTLEIQNSVVDAGSLDLPQRRLRIEPTGTFLSPQDIGDLTIVAQAGSGDELVRIRDIGTVRRGYADPPRTMMRFDGIPSIGLSISNESGVNIVEVGRALDKRLQELEDDLPVGIEFHRVHWQSDVVSGAVNGFLMSFAEAVGIVIVVITLFMGWRMGLVIGMSLMFTILATFIMMAMLEIDLQRISLGALVVALGMMVDNAIVVADGYAARLRQGLPRATAAAKAADVPAIPLFGATIIAVMAFYPIYASPLDVGEYCATLFLVIGLSLVLSWVISMTITPLQCMDFIKPAANGATAKEGRFLGAYRRFIKAAIRFRWLTVATILLALVGSGAAFTQVKQLFFPASAMPKFMIDLWEPEGARLSSVSEKLAQVEDRLLADDRIAGVASFIGSGPPRFYLPVDPEGSNPAYGQLIVNVHDPSDIIDLIADLTPWMQDRFPDSLPVLRQFGVGPSNSWKIEARISGPVNADPQTLRDVAAQVSDVIRADPLTAYVRNDWRQRVRKVVVDFDQERAGWSAIARDDVANATKRAYDGLPVGLYREGDELIQILLRQAGDGRSNVSGIEVLSVVAADSVTSVPLAQVVDGIRTEWEDPMIQRRDRRRTITVQANPIFGVTAPTLEASIMPKVAALELPRGYTLEWGGDFESTQDANASLVPGLIPALAIIAVITVGLFNAFRPPLIILCVIPTALIGVSVGLLALNAAFGFVALLGAMSLVGMMIKNAIVLLDQINIELAEGRTPYDAVIEASVSRLSPVMLAAATTVLGVIPLLSDVFWVGLAAAVMGGLAFGSLLTMIAVPVLYAIFFGVRAESTPATAAESVTVLEATEASDLQTAP